MIEHLTPRDAARASEPTPEARLDLPPRSPPSQPTTLPATHRKTVPEFAAPRVLLRSEPARLGCRQTPFRQRCAEGTPSAPDAQATYERSTPSRRGERQEPHEPARP